MNDWTRELLDRIPWSEGCKRLRAQSITAGNPILVPMSDEKPKGTVDSDYYFYNTTIPNEPVEGLVA